MERATTANPRASKLPILKSSVPPSNDDIYQLKIKIQNMEEEKKHLKTKITRMRQVIRDRNHNVANTFAESSTKNPLVTASPAAIKSLKESISALENTLQTRKEEKEVIFNGDKVSFYKELQYEIEILYLEKQRLLEENQTISKENSQLQEVLDRTRSQASSGSYYEDQVKELQSEINVLTDKLFAYQKNELKIQAGEKMQNMVFGKIQRDDLLKEIQADIQKIQEETEQERNELKEIQENESKAVQEIKQIIASQIEQLNNLLSPNQEDTEEDRPDE